MARSNMENILYLFERPIEPLFVPKGDRKIVFDLPLDYVNERYQDNFGEITNRFGAQDAEVNHIRVEQIAIPDISFPLQLGRRDNFSLFIPYHRKLAARLIDIFMGMRTFDDFLSASAFCRERVNPYLFIYALSVAILHRPDTRNLAIPPLSEVFPGKYMDSAVFALAKEEANVVPVGSRLPLEIPMDYTASDLEEEHRVAYFREDLGINLHHWHWHLVYPFEAARNIVDKDRRGELFFYMHQQIVARYNFERFSNNLGRVRRFLNWREPIKEGYFPKLDSLVASRVWPPRHANASISDINREVEQIKFDIQDLERWRDRIFQAIHTGVIIDDAGKSVPLTELGGINILGNILEASILSPNKNLYGDLHNFGHVAIALAHDPDHRHLETFSVMGDPATAMRDPVFYRWHAFIDDIFQEHKNTLPSYKLPQLDYTGIQVTAVEITTSGSKLKNQMETFWQQNDVDLSRGLDFTPRGSVFARFTHLQHAPFSYKIQVTNATNANRVGTVRIFMAPKFDERGLPLLFRDQKGLFIEMDKFQITMKPKGNVVERRSKDSNVTIPFERTFRNLDNNRPAAGTGGLEQFNFCGCGWPEHMLVPKGAAGPFPCQLFVMVSNFNDDKVDQTNDGACSDASSYCGIRDKLFPDKRSMGYPFDRSPRPGVDTMDQFLTPNMRLQDVFIHFTDRVDAPRAMDASNKLN